MKRIIASVIIVIAVIVIIAAFLVFQVTAPTGKYDKLTKCLTEKGVIMYGTDTCSACVFQKELLGDSFKYINYVNCVDQYQICVNQGILATPTWIINSTLIAMVLEPQELANYSGCVI